MVGFNRLGFTFGLTIVRSIVSFLGRRDSQKLSAQGKLLLAMTIGQKAGVPNFHEPARQDVQKETSNELGPFKRRRFPFCPISIVGLF
jgi:hypothetical protein